MAMAVTTATATAATSLVIPVHHQPPVTLHLHRRTCRLLPPLVPARNPSVQASPSRSSTLTVKEPAPDPPAEEDNAPGPRLSAENKERLQSRGCKACGREEIEEGCNGEGRIQGGIATVPGFSWWPIKAYRPCPGFIESGGRYRRQGQSMDEVAFGRGERETSLQSTNEGETR